MLQRSRAHAQDVWVIGQDPCPIQTGTADEDWLPQVAQQRLTVVRIDTDLLQVDTPSYKAWRRWGCRGFVLNIKQSQSTVWDQTRAIVRQWDKIENHIADRVGDPWWIGKITQSYVRPA